MFRGGHRLQDGLHGSPERLLQGRDQGGVQGQVHDQRGVPDLLLRRQRPPAALLPPHEEREREEPQVEDDERGEEELQVRGLIDPVMISLFDFCGIFFVTGQK